MQTHRTRDIILDLSASLLSFCIFVGSHQNVPPFDMATWLKSGQQDAGEQSCREGSGSFG